MAEKTRHQQIRDQIDSDIEFRSKQRRAFQDDLEFAVLGGEKQWDAAEWSRRVANRLPKITYNVCGPLIRRVANAIVSKAYSVHVTAQGEGSSQEMAEFRAGIIRAIEITGGAEAARAMAVRSQVIGGFGAYRLVVSQDGAGNPEIKYERILNPLQVVPDTSAKAVNFSDMRRCTVYVDMPKETYKAEFPDGSATSVEDDIGGSGEWLQEDRIRVAEYWSIQPDGSVLQTIMDGAGILAENAFPGKHIPIFFLVGEETDVAGEVVYKGVIRDIKEPQRFKNLWKSEEYEYLSGKKQPPAWLTPDMVDDPSVLASHDGDASRAFRLWMPDPSGVQPIFPPAPEIPSGYANASAEATEEIKAMSGIFDVHLGQQTGQSGRAMLVQAEQADIGTYHLEANLRALIEYEGTVLNGLLSIFADQQMTLHASEDGKLTSQEITAIQGIREDLAGFNGGTYGIRVTSGPNFRTKREQFVSMLSEIGTKNPIIAQLAAPELILALDIPGAQDLSALVEKWLIKQGMREPKQDDKQGGDPRAMLDQMAQAMEALQAELAEATKARTLMAQRIQELEAATDADLQRTAMQARAQIQKAEIDSAAKIQAAQIAAETDLQIAAMKEQGSTSRAILDVATTPTPAATAPVVDVEIEPDEGEYLPLLAQEGVQ
jgi:hypothetical protein